MKTYEADKGENFYEAVKKVQALAKKEGVADVVLIFNEHKINVNINSHIPDLCTIYDLKCLVLRMTLRID